MKIKLPKNKLLTGIQRVSGIITQKNTLPILSNILLETSGNKIRLVGTDLEIGICYTTEAEILEKGGITIPAKKIGDIIKELPEGDVIISSQKNNTIIITTQKSFFKIMGLPKEDFPDLPKIKNECSINTKQKLLKTMLGMTSFAISYDATRYVLNGTLFSLKDKQLRLVTTDGRRLSLIQKKLDNPTNIKKEVIIPLKTTNELNRILKEEGEVKISFDQNQIVFELNNTTIISRLIEGQFPNYQQVIPKEVEQKITLRREEFLGAVKRAGLLAPISSRSIKLELFKNRILTSSQAPDIGEAREEMDISYGGKELVVGFNSNYLVDVLKNMDREEIVLELTDAQGAGVVRGGEDYLYVLMPVQLG